MSKLKVMQVRQRNVTELGRLGYGLNRLMAKRFMNNGWTHIQVNGHIYKPRVETAYGEVKGVFYSYLDEEDHWVIS